nr:uncharacterized protein LOC111856889 [Paramormyrops kingsleyae]
MQRYVMSKMKQQKEKELFNCQRCSRRHPPKQCPAYGKVCAKCKGQNHCAKQCFSKANQGQKERVHAVEETDLSDKFFIGLVEQADSSQEITEQTDVNTVAQDKWMTALEINGVIVSLKLDTGAKVNLISEPDVRAMKIKPRISPKTVRLKVYNGQHIPTKGTCRLQVKMRNKIHHLKFVVVPGGHDSVLGDKACEDLGLVKRVYVINSGETKDTVKNIVAQFPDIFEGFGVLPFTYKIQLKKDQSVFHAPRRVPAPLCEKLRQELETVTSMGVIEKVEEPTNVSRRQAAEGEKWRPVAYASRTMTPTECRYAQIEKECLGLVYGVERFHSYVYGLPTFVAETDHKPLIAIIKKNLNQMSPRIQRLMMRLQRGECAQYYNIRTELSGQRTSAETEQDRYPTVTASRDVEKAT